MKGLVLLSPAPDMVKTNRRLGFLGTEVRAGRLGLGPPGLAVQLRARWEREVPFAAQPNETART